MDELTPFAFWCQKVMPAVLDDSLSFYEVLCKLTAKLNDAIETINGHSELITTMQSEIAALQTLTAQHTQQIADLTKKVQANANNITAINTRTKGLSTKTDSKNNYWGINFTTDDNYVYRLAWSNGAPAASVLQTSRPGSIYYQNGGVSDDWAYLSVQDGTNTSRPGYTSISRTIYNQITSDINDVESSAAQNAQAIKALQDLTSDHSTAISSLQDSVGKNTQDITNLNNGLSSTNQTVAKLESSLETLNTRTKGISTNISGDGAWYGITLNTDTDLNYRIAWCNNTTADMLSTSSRGSIYLFNQGLSSVTGTVGWSQTATNNVEAWYKGLSNATVTNINNQIDDLDTRLTSIGSRTNTLENKTKGFSTVNDTVSGWFGFNLLVGSDNYRIGWSPSAPIEAVTEASAPGSLYLTQTGLTGNTYGYSQTGAQEVKTLYNGSDTSSIENEIESLQTTVNEINTRTKGISTKTDASNSYQAINFTTDAGKVYRIGWIGDTPSSTVASSSDKGSFYFYVNGTSQNTGNFGWSQLDNSFQSIYNGILKTNMTTLSDTVSKHTQQISTLMDDVNNNVSDINDLQTNLASATNTITQVGTLANEINTRTKGLSTKTDSSDNWIGISLSTDDSYIYRVAWSNETPALPVLQQSSPGSLYLRIGGPVPDIWLYAWDQDGTDTAMPLATVKI